MINKEIYGTSKSILIANDSYLVSLPVRVTNTGITADANGNKILKAGTPIKGDITNRDTAFTIGGAADSTAILLHDVDVTKGASNGTMILAGCVDLLKLDTSVVALVNALTTKIPNIIFVKGSAI
ncbi:MAG: hypothetical protein RR708_04400 [Bacilli bacterium]